jgi:hypothetical protein
LDATPIAPDTPDHQLDGSDEAASTLDLLRITWLSPQGTPCNQSELASRRVNRTCYVHTAGGVISPSCVA